MHKTLLIPLLLLAANPVFAGQCEDNFTKTGGVFKGANYNSSVAVPNLSVKDGMGQMRGIMISEKMDVLTEDAASGTMLVEQRSTGTTRPIPTIISISTEGTNATVDMTVKTEKGMFAKQEDIKIYMCKLLSQVKGGKEGKLAGSKGSKTQNNADTTQRDVFIFSREIANEAKKNAVAVNARHKGRSYSLKGKIDYIQEDGEDYNVSFDIPEIHEMVLRPLPGDAQFRVGVACLFRPNQLAWVLTMREGQSVTFTGSFYRYDDFKKMVWLENCKQVMKK
ncbi:MAG: hypothetical protein ACREPB_15185 [Arenimonas sp.]